MSTHNDGPHGPMNESGNAGAADDPRLTAYALGELEPVEAAEVEQMLAESAEARATVAEITAAATALTAGFATEAALAAGADASSTLVVDSVGRNSTSASAATAGGNGAAVTVSVVRIDRGWRILRTMSIAASIVVAVGIPAVWVFSPSLSGARELSTKLQGERGVGQGMWTRDADGDGVPDSTQSADDSQSSFPTHYYVGDQPASAPDSGDEISSIMGYRFAAGEPWQPYISRGHGGNSYESYGYQMPPAEGADMLAANFRVPLEADQRAYFTCGVTNSSSNITSDQRAQIVTTLTEFGLEFRDSRFSESDAYDIAWELSDLFEPAPQTLDSDEVGPPYESPSAETYDPVVHNPFLLTLRNPLSTFSIDVDTASYANVRRFLNEGSLPPASAVRVEELINYFTYDYPEPGQPGDAVAATETGGTPVPPMEGDWDTGDSPAPQEETGRMPIPQEDSETGRIPIPQSMADDRPFSVTLDVAECPWTPDHLLMRVGLKGREIPELERASANLVFLLDVSGSMNEDNKLPLVKQSLTLLAEQLYADDSVAIVVYAGASGLVLPAVAGDDYDTIVAAMDQLSAGGSTNGGEGIQLAYDIAAQHFIEGGINRVILATDGDFNVGVTDRSELVSLIEERAVEGVFLTVLGYGMGDLQDATLEQLADKGNGNYAYIDSLREAKKVLVDQIGGTLNTIAKDVKIQVEFNPAEVAAYRLIGYENRVLAARDFNDDTKDAGEIGAGHTVTALYEIVPADVIPPEVGPPAALADSAGVDADGNPIEGAPGAFVDGEGDARPRNPAIKFSLDDGVVPDPIALAAQDLMATVIEDPGVDPLKYATPATATAAALGLATDELATIKLRYKQPDGDTSRLIEAVAHDEGRTLAEMHEDFQFASAVASFGMILRGSPYANGWTLAAVRELASGAIGTDAEGYRTEFIELVDKAISLSGPGGN